MSKTTAFTRTRVIRFGAVLTGAAALAGAATLMFSSSSSQHAASAPGAVVKGNQASVEFPSSTVTVSVKPLSGFVTCTAAVDTDQEGLSVTSDQFRPGTKLEVINPDNRKAVVVTVGARVRDSGTCAGMSQSAFKQISDDRAEVDDALVRPVA